MQSIVSAILLTRLISSLVGEEMYKAPVNLTLSTFRHSRDAVHGLKCSDIRAQHATGAVCFCKARRSTLMSNHESPYACRKPRHVGCRYHVGSSLVHLVEKDFSEQLEPAYEWNSNSRYQIQVWNIHPHSLIGYWTDVTDAARDQIRISGTPGKSGLSGSSESSGNNETGHVVTSNFNMKLWRGHVMKITFWNVPSTLEKGDVSSRPNETSYQSTTEEKINPSTNAGENSEGSGHAKPSTILSRQAKVGSSAQHCVVIKVRGSRDYPFNMAELKKELTLEKTTTNNNGSWLDHVHGDVIIVISLTVMLILTIVFIILCCRKKSGNTVPDVEEIEDVVGGRERRGEALLTGFLYESSLGDDVESATSSFKRGASNCVLKRASNGTMEYLQVCENEKQKDKLTSSREKMTSLNVLNNDVVVETRSRELFFKRPTIDSETVIVRSTTKKHRRLCFSFNPMSACRFSMPGLSDKHPVAVSM